MKINAIRSRNILGARDIDLALTTPITLICGENGAGKSSLQEGIRMAFQGEILRVTHKKDFALMVTEGAKEGYIRMDVDGQIAEYKLPAGEHVAPTLNVPADQLQCVLDAQRFASLSTDARRAFLTVLTKTNPNKEKISAMLAEVGIPQERIDATIPMLRGGFPAACDSAKQKATEAKGAWKAITGETYGSKKGETWEAPSVLSPPADEMEHVAGIVSKKEDALSELQQKLGGIVEKMNEQKKRAKEIADAQEKVKNLPRLRDKLLRDEEGRAQYEKSVAELEAKAGAAPKVGLVHDLAFFINGIVFDDDLKLEAEDLIKRYVAEFGPIGGKGDPEALAALPAHRKSLDLMEKSVANDKRDIAQAEQAEMLLASLGAAEPIDETVLAKAREDVAKAQKDLEESREELNALQALAKAAAERDAKTAAAKAHHEDVLGWTKVAEQLAPDGIPGQLLAQALKPINNLLRGYATATEWRQVSIATDMSITADGRPYALHSESERWMIDAHIAAAIAEISGIKLLLLDRFDVLSVRNRPNLLYWLDEMAIDGRIDCAIVSGTLKEPPKGVPDTIEVCWIQNGEHTRNSVAMAA